MEGITTAIATAVGSLTTLITDNLPVVLTAAALLLGATVVWRLVRRFIR